MTADNTPNNDPNAIRDLIVRIMLHLDGQDTRRIGDAFPDLAEMRLCEQVERQLAFDGWSCLSCDNWDDDIKACRLGVSGKCTKWTGA